MDVTQSPQHTTLADTERLPHLLAGCMKSIQSTATGRRKLLFPCCHQRPSSLKIGDIGMGLYFPAQEARDVIATEDTTDARGC